MKYGCPDGHAVRTATLPPSVIDKGKSSRINGFSWAPDGEWVAYSVSISTQRSALKLWQADGGQITQLTEPVLHDVEPAFDPAGKYLYFLSYRYFNPVYDNLHFDLNFPRGMQPFLITLQDDLLSPFVPQPRAPGKKSSESNNNKRPEAKDKEGKSAEEPPANGEDGEKKDRAQKVQIDQICWLHLF